MICYELSSCFMSHSIHSGAANTALFRTNEWRYGQMWPAVISIQLALLFAISPLFLEISRNPHPACR